MKQDWVYGWCYFNKSEKPTPKPVPETKKSGSRIFYVIIGVFVISVVIGLVVLIKCICNKKQIKNSKKAVSDSNISNPLLNKSDMSQKSCKYQESESTLVVNKNDAL